MRDLFGPLDGAVARPIAARAQPGELPVVGYLYSGPTGIGGPNVAAFLRGLREAGEAGYVEGRGTVIETRWGDHDRNWLPALAADLTSRLVALIVAAPVSAARAAHAATSRFPFRSRPARRTHATAWVTSLDGLSQ